MSCEKQKINLFNEVPSPPATAILAWLFWLMSIVSQFLDEARDISLFQYERVTGECFSVVIGFLIIMFFDALAVSEANHKLAYTIESIMCAVCYYVAIKIPFSKGFFLGRIMCVTIVAFLLSLVSFVIVEILMQKLNEKRKQQDDINN